MAATAAAALFASARDAQDGGFACTCHATCAVAAAQSRRASVLASAPRTAARSLARSLAPPTATTPTSPSPSYSHVRPQPLRCRDVNEALPHLFT